MTTEMAPEVKRKSISLSYGELKLTVLAKRIRSGWETSVITTDAQGKTQRGMTQRHETFDGAVAQLVELVQDAVKKGWRKSERAGGFKPRPDAFDTIPPAAASEITVLKTGVSKRKAGGRS